MKASKFTGARKAFVVKQGEEGTPVAEICRKAGLSQATYFNWKKRYPGLMASEMRRLRELEDENNRLKKIVADLTPDPRCFRRRACSKMIAFAEHGYARQIGQEFLRTGKIGDVRRAAYLWTEDNLSAEEVY